MANVLTINGSPSSSSRTSALLADLARRLEAEGHRVQRLNVRELPAEDLLHGRANAGGIASAVAEVVRADGIVIGTPIYKASYTGILKAFLDLLPQFAFDQKTVLPVATGGTLAHVLALDYGLRPVLSALGARHVVGSHFVLDKALELDANGQVALEAPLRDKYLVALAAFTDSLQRHSPSEPRPQLEVSLPLASSA
jgi:FMN reductase